MEGFPGLAPQSGPDIAEQRSLKVDTMNYLLAEIPAEHNLYDLISVTQQIIQNEKSLFKNKTQYALKIHVHNITKSFSTRLSSLTFSSCQQGQRCN